MSQRSGCPVHDIDEHCADQCQAARQEWRKLCKHMWVYWGHRRRGVQPLPAMHPFYTQHDHWQEQQGAA